MPLHFSAAHSSRITKKLGARSPLRAHSLLSPYVDLRRTRPAQRSASKSQILAAEDDFSDDCFDYVGLARTLAPTSNLSNVVQIIKYAQCHMFDSVPQHCGFDSRRIAEILNFRASLPPAITVTHVHATLDALTTAEREISELMRAGIVRKFITPGRGTGSSSVGESLALSKDIEKLLRTAKGIDEDLADLFWDYLSQNPVAQSLGSTLCTAAQIDALIRAGFLTSTSAINSLASAFCGPQISSPDGLTSVSSVSRATSGSLGASGGEDAIFDAGGRVGMRRRSSPLEIHHDQRADALDLQLSLPGTGSYLRLLTTARSHLIWLIKKSRSQPMELRLLREHWEGGIQVDSSAVLAKKRRGEVLGVSPGRTRKWKQFHGLSFNWILTECVGSGLIELFETGSVGRAVRLL